MKQEKNLFCDQQKILFYKRVACLRMHKYETEVDGNVPLAKSEVFENWYNNVLHLTALV